MKIKKIKPMFTSILTTMNKYIDTDVTMASGIVDVSKMKTGLSEYQKVLAIGDSVRGISVGDMVCINPSNYAVKKYQENSTNAAIMENTVQRYNFNVIEVDGEECLLLQDRDVDFIITEYED